MQVATFSVAARQLNFLQSHRSPLQANRSRRKDRREPSEILVWRGGHARKPLQIEHPQWCHSQSHQLQNERDREMNIQNSESKSFTNHMVAMLHPREVAQHLGVSVGTLAKWRCEKSQPLLRYVKVGRAVRYRLEAVQAYLNARESGGEPEMA